MSSSVQNGAEDSGPFHVRPATKRKARMPRQPDKLTARATGLASPHQRPARPRRTLLATPVLPLPLSRVRTQRPLTALALYLLPESERRSFASLLLID